MIDLCQGPECARPVHVKIHALCRSHYNQRQRGWDLRPLVDSRSYANPRDRRLQYTYNLSEDQYERMLSDQGRTCATCPATPDQGILVVDHDHSCCPGIRSCGSCIRGLLCNACNTALGFVNDDIQTLSRLIDYLRSRAI